GRWDVVGPVSDVYSLGATLYYLLTGRTAVTGRDTVEILEKAQRGDFPRPRQVSRAVPAALEAVCLKAMALRRGRRRSAAAELAAEVERWLADEPVRAYREPLAVRARRWVRRRRTLAVALTAALLVALLLVSGGGLWMAGQWAMVRTQARADLKQAEEA